MRSCPVRVILLGAPGSGKGTQGERLAHRLGVPHIASGELLRAQVRAGSEIGRDIAARLARGDLVPDDLVIEIVGAAVRAATEAGGYILDGFPRTRAQAERAHELAVELGVEAQAAVYLALDDDVARARLAGRAAGGRVDDADAEVIEHRLQVFHDNMRPILDFYDELGILVTIDAAQPPDVVTEEILAALASMTGFPSAPASA
ncbi:MAG: adenylate kinase [Actinomycetota bacterium]|nr:adenylate kinase [Actinomycetota bacterium]MDQ1384356.1 adenylate kinase [Actinomycetota bacterium]